MRTTLTVRFCETERYDPMTDTERVRLMAITSRGTWHSEVELGRHSKLRENREAFRTYVLQSMALGQEPKEVNLG